MAAFEEMGLMSEIAKSVEEMDWLLPTDIQAEAIPLILGGGDVLMAAETGSGKTGAFSLPLLQIVWETLHNGDSKCKKNDDRWLFSVSDRSTNLVLNADCLSAQSKSQVWEGVRANRALKRSNSEKDNKFYYEIEFLEAGLARIGWSLGGASHDLGTDAFGWGYGGTAKKSNNRTFTDYGEKFGDKGDVIGSIIDLDSGKISWTKNGHSFRDGVAFSLDQNMAKLEYYPALCTKNATIKVRFLPDSGKSSLPAGSKWVGHCNASQFVVNRFGSTDDNKGETERGPKAIIIEPTRELAQQTLTFISTFKKHIKEPIKEVLLVGGGNTKEQINELARGVDIIVATPGRLQEMMDTNIISFGGCSFFVLDEVDALLQQSHLPLIERIHSKIPRMFSDGRRLQMIICSATLHNFDVKKLAQRLMYFPTWIDLKGEDSVPDTVHHVFLKIDPQTDHMWRSLDRCVEVDEVHQHVNNNELNAETLSQAIKVLKGEYVVKAIDTLKMDQGIIFCRTKLDCDNLENYFNKLQGANARANPYSCVCLHGDRRPQERTQNLEYFKSKKVKFLICTDVAARGIDIKGVPFVIQVTLPDEKANYLHRIGRVGRADRMGLAISLVAMYPEKVWYHSNCNTRGKGCYNRNLTDSGGCCIWYNELQLFREIEDHLNCTIQETGRDFKIGVNEFDGKVVYGEKRKADSSFGYENHVSQLMDVVNDLTQLEAQAQTNYFNMYYLKKYV